MCLSHSTQSFDFYDGLEVIFPIYILRYIYKGFFLSRIKQYCGMPIRSEQSIGRFWFGFYRFSQNRTEPIRNGNWRRTEPTRFGLVLLGYSVRSFWIKNIFKKINFNHFSKLISLRYPISIKFIIYIIYYVYTYVYAYILRYIYIHIYVCVYI